MLIGGRRAWGLLPPSCLHPSPPTPGGRGAPRAPRPLPSPPGAARGAAEERAPAGSGGELLAGGPADFLLISSRKPAPCASLRTAPGRGESGALCASCPRGGAGRGAGEGHRAARAGGDPGFLGRCQPRAGRWNFELRRCGASPAPSLCRERDLGAGASGEGGGRGGARHGRPSRRGCVDRRRAVSLECPAPPQAAGWRPEEVGAGPGLRVQRVHLETSAVTWVTGGVCRRWEHRPGHSLQGSQPAAGWVGGGLPQTTL